MTMIKQAFQIQVVVYMVKKNADLARWRARAELKLSKLIFSFFNFIEDKQVIDIARHIASKQQVLDSILLSETNYVNNLCTFHEVYAVKIEAWLIETTDKDVVAKFKSTSARKDLDRLFRILHDLAAAHREFLSELKER